MAEQTAGKKSSYKKLFSNTVIFAIGSFSSKILVLLLVKVYTTYLTRDELGVNDVITQIANWLQPVVTMTISEAVIRFGLDKAYDKKKVFTLGNIVCLAGFAVLGIILPVVAISGAADIYLGGYSGLLYVYVVMSGLKLVYSTFVRALDKVKLFAFNGILTTLLTLVGTIVFMMGFRMGNTGYLLSIIVSDFLSVVFLTFAAKLWRYIEFKRPDRELLRVMLRYSMPLIPAQILWLITNSSDSFMTTHYMGQAANGVLSASYKIPNLVATVYFTFGQAWNMSAIIEDDSDDRNEFYSNVFELNQCLLYIIAAGCLMIVRPLTRIWFGPEFWDSALYSPLLIFSSVFSCFVTFLGSIYLTSKRTMRSMVTSLFSGIINVGLNIILIPRIGLYGPAFSTVASYLVVFIIRAYDSRKIVPFDLKLKKLVANTVLLAAMVFDNIENMRNHREGISYIILPVIFILIFLMNYRPLWGAFSKMLPKRVVTIVERLGVYRVIAICVVLCGIVGASVLTKGWIFYLTSAAALSVGLMLHRQPVALGAAALCFVTVWAEVGIGAASFVGIVMLLMLVVVFRRRIYLPAVVLLADICIASLWGFWAVTLVICAEMLAAGVIFRNRLFSLVRGNVAGKIVKTKHRS
ncbi:MAG: polysaccharide biosynthesis C-terminal domain-containing protein [Ruminococcus sp.]|nr:polysaccharide biosynthesis C-terminal domain-containing protein [Ruminococcus sp.]